MEELKIVLDSTEEKMKKIIEALKEHLKVIRTGRATPSILEGIMVDYYGVETPITHVGSINVQEANLLVIQPWDKTALKIIEKAIIASERGLNPNNDGNVIRIPIPSLTKERRGELVKQVKKVSEEFKIQIRNARRDGNYDLKKIEKCKVPEDSLKEIEEKIQNLTDSYIKKIDEIAKNKEIAIMEI